MVNLNEDMDRARSIYCYMDRLANKDKYGKSKQRNGPGPVYILLYGPAG